MDDNHLSAWIDREGVVGAVAEPRPAQTSGGEDQPAVTEVRVEPWGSDQLTAMMSVDRLAHPAHRISGAEAVEDVTVVQDRFHHDIMAAAEPARALRSTIPDRTRTPQRGRPARRVLCRGEVPIKDVLAFAGVAVVPVAVPGPSVMFTISGALTYGRRTVLLNLAGNALGQVVQVMAVAVGLGVVIERSPELFTGLKLAGAAYLVWLGLQAILHRCYLAETVAAQVPPLRPLGALRDGVVAGATNPKTIAVFLIVMPQFASPGSGHLTSQLLVISMVGRGRCAGWFGRWWRGSWQP